LRVLVPEMLFTTVTPVPDGVKLTLPGPSATVVYDATTFAAEEPVAVESLGVKKIGFDRLRTMSTVRFMPGSDAQVAGRLMQSPSG
jgi:hypothetical protein